MPPIIWGILILGAVILLPLVAIVVHATEGKAPAPKWKQRRSVHLPASAQVGLGVEQVREGWRPQSASTQSSVGPSPHHHQAWRATRRKPWRAQTWARGN